MAAKSTNPQEYGDPLKQCLAVLLIAKSHGPDSWMTGAQISVELRDRYGINLHWRKIYSLLCADPTLASRRKRKISWYFSIMAAGERLLRAPDDSIIFVEPNKALKSVRTLHDLLGSLRGTICVCDPYLDKETIHHLDACRNGNEIRLLTHNITDSGPLRALANTAANSINLAIRKAPRNVLHDRYVLDKSSMLILGTSLNSLGKKQSFIIKCGVDIRQVVLDAFNKLWNRGKPWP